MKTQELLEFARSGDDDGADGPWKKLKYKGESVYYCISRVSMLDKNYGLQVQVALYSLAPNAASEFLHDKSIQAYNKTEDELDGDALKLVFKYLNEHGTSKLKALADEWDEETRKFNQRSS